MNFVGVGPAELIVILVVALVFVGPERLPRLAADIARTIREIRKYTGSLAAEFNEVIQDFEKDTAGERSEWKEIGEGLTGATKSVTDAIRGARSDMAGTPASAAPLPGAQNATQAAAPNGTAANIGTNGAELPIEPVRSVADVSSEKWVTIGEPGTDSLPLPDSDISVSKAAATNSGAQESVHPRVPSVASNGVHAPIDAEDAK